MKKDKTTWQREVEEKDYLWINIDTGQIVSEEGIDLGHIPENLEKMMKEEISQPKIDGEVEWLEWWGKRKLLIKYEMELLRTQYHRRLHVLQFRLTDHETLVPYVRDLVRRLLEEEDSRSLELPSCRIGFRLTPPKSEIVDLEAAIEWCGEHCPSAVKIETSIWKKQLPDKGRHVPGIEVTQEDKLYVKGGK
jgi:hypothetical protein